MRVRVKGMGGGGEGGYGDVVPLYWRLGQGSLGRVRRKVYMFFGNQECWLDDLVVRLICVHCVPCLRCAGEQCCVRTDDGSLLGIIHTSIKISLVQD